MDKGSIKILVNAVLFLLPIVVALGTLEWRVRSIPNPYATKWTAVQRAGKAAEVVILGSSHTAAGLDPGHFAIPGLNLANDAQDYFYDTELLRAALPHLPKLRVVVFDVSYFSFWYRLNQSPNGWRQFIYHQQLGLPIEQSGMSPLDLRRYSRVALHGPTEALHYALHKNESFGPVVTSSGWQRIDKDGSSGPTVETGLKRLQYHQSLIDKAALTFNLQRLGSVIKILHERGVRVVLLSTPIFETYRSAESSSVIAENQQVIKHLCDEFNCEYMDYSDDSRFSRSDFADDDHLNIVGAQKLTSIFNREVLARDTRDILRLAAHQNPSKGTQHGSGESAAASR